MKIVSGRKADSGVAVLVVLCLLAILAVLVANNVRVLNQLKFEINSLDKKERQRFEGKPPGTTDVGAKTNLPPKQPSP